jgi:hypothetical protein
MEYNTTKGSTVLRGNPVIDEQPHQHDQLYSKLWNETDSLFMTIDFFLTDYRMPRRPVTQTEPRLLEYFNNRKGSYRSDICGR